jgi:hypothetical protein
MTNLPIEKKVLPMKTKKSNIFENIHFLWRGEEVEDAKMLPSQRK